MGSRRLAWTLALSLASLLGCADQSPVIVDVQVLRDSADPFGAHSVTAEVRGGDGELQVRLLLTDGHPAELDGACSPGIAQGPWRGVDAAPPPENPCSAIELEARGAFWTGRFTGPPWPLGTRLFWRLEALDEDGDLARWPAGDPRSLVIGPLGLPPSLVALAPSEGPASGGTEVLLRGAALGPDTEVFFGGEPAPRVEAASEHLLVVETPPGLAGRVDVTAARGGLEARLEGAFRFIAPPELIRLSPAEGPTAGETQVVIDGRGFEPGAVAQLDEEALDATWLSDRRIAFVTPQHAAGEAQISVTNPDGQSSEALTFTFWPPPVLASIEPFVGPDSGGTRVRVTGADLRSPGALYLGQRAGLDLLVDADGRGAEFTSPVHPEGFVDVTWFNPDGQFSALEQAWRFLGPPFIESVDPDVVSRCGGGLVTLIGRNFVEGMQVFVGGRPAEVVEIAPDGASAVVRTPEGASGPTSLEVINPDGRRYRDDDLLSYGVRPVVRSVDRARVPIWGGVTVIIEGGDFDAGAVASFGGVDAEVSNVLQAGCEARVEAVVAAHEAGLVEVAVRNPDGVSAALPEAVEYVAPVLEPDHGLVPGYANVRLLGVDLRPGLRLRIGDENPRSLERVSDEEWAVLTPAGPRGRVSIEVRNADGRGAELEGAFGYRQFVDGTEGRLTPTGDCNDVTVGDVDADGDLDLVSAHGGLGGVGQVEQLAQVWRNDGSGVFPREALEPAGNGMNAKLGDLDGDGDPDLLVANLSSPRNHYFRNEGGRFAFQAGFVGRGPSYDADFLDADGDGDLDVFTLATGDPVDNPAQGPDRLYLNQGGGRLEESPGAVEFDPGDVHDHDFGHGDLDGDGLSDVVIVVDNISEQFRTASNRMLLNRGGRFEEVPSPFNDFPGDWLHAELADIDADGDLDVLLPQDYLEGISRPGTPAIAVWTNDGSANFTLANERIHGLDNLPAFEVVAADLDGDGDLDLALAVYGILYQDGSIDAFDSTVLLNDGRGHFWNARGALEDGRAAATADYGVGDFDGDGDPDLFECAARSRSRLWIQAE